MESSHRQTQGQQRINVISVLWGGSIRETKYILVIFLPPPPGSSLLFLQIHRVQQQKVRSGSLRAFLWEAKMSIFVAEPFIYTNGNKK